MKHLLTPSDYQNVPAAVELLSNLQTDTCAKGQLTATIISEIDCFNKIVKPFLDILTNPKINLYDQLRGLALSSHLLLFLYRKWKKRFLTKQLYMDLQSTIQCAFCCTVTCNKFYPDLPLYL